MAPPKSGLSPVPLSPRSPAQQNVPSKSPFGKPLPLRKPSLRDSAKSPQKPTTSKQTMHSSHDDTTTDSPSATKRRRLDHSPPTTSTTTNSKPTDYDPLELINKQIESKYIKGKFLGSGTYATVYKGHLKSNPDHLVAIKRFKISVEQREYGIQVDILREIKYLQELSHPNICMLQDVFSSKDTTISAVIEFCRGGNLEDLIKDFDISYGLADIKAWMAMLFRAVYFCHRNFVLHRDIKPGNLLIGDNGTLKLADFGLARKFAAPDERMSYLVITLWYRPPELLFGGRHYGGAVDIWSCGMILAELLIRRPFVAFIAEDADALAQAGSELAQLDVMNSALGTPLEENWPGVSKLPNYVELTPRRPLRDKRWFQNMFTAIDDPGLDLLRLILTYDPRKRLTAKGCLEDEWWTTDPRPTDSKDLPRKKEGVEEGMGKAMAKEPGVAVEEKLEERFKGVAKKLDFGAASGKR